MARKRAPGGGRKPIGSAAARPLTIRMDDDMRRQLEAAVGRQKVSKPQKTWNLSQEILWRLRVSLHDEHEEERRDPALRALCFLIERLTHHIVGPVPAHWRSDLFLYRAFKIAVHQLLDALEPPGPGMRWVLRGKHPDANADAYMQRYIASFDSPEARATHSADLILSELRNIPSWSPRRREQERKLLETLPPYYAISFYGMPDAARDLALKPQSGGKVRSTVKVRPILWARREESDEEPKR